MAKYLDIFTDYGFKKIFGEEANKGFLIDFLNSLLPDKARIKELTFKNNEKLGIRPDSRSAVYDIYCENEQGEKFIVELQKIKHKCYLDRTIFYSTFAIGDDAQTGDWDLKPVYCISLLDFRLADDAGEDSKVVQRVTLKNEEGREVYHKLTYIYIEMPNFNKKEHELVTRLDQWLYFIKNLENFEVIPEIFKNEVLFSEVIEKAELAKMNAEDRAKYEYDLKMYRNNIANINTAEEDGATRKALEMAGKCLQKGMSIADIAEITGLTAAEINAIKI